MKGLIRHFVISLAVLYITSLLLPGLVITGGLQGLLVSSIFLVVGLSVIKPILSILTLPLGIITFGLFSIVTTAIVLFLISFVYSDFSIHPFQFPGFSFFILQIPSFHANILLSYVLVSATIQVIYRIFGYIFDL